MVPAQPSFVFHNPRVVTELLAVLVEPLHLSADHRDLAHLSSRLTPEVYADLYCGKLHASAVAVLWKQFGRSHGLNDKFLQEFVIDILVQLVLIVADVSTAGLYYSPLLMKRFDFRDSHRRIAASFDGRQPALESPWYAVDFVFGPDSGSCAVAVETVSVPVGLAPEGLMERLLLRLYEQQSRWWVARSASGPLHMHNSDATGVLTLYRDCLTDGKSCEVSLAMSRPGDRPANDVVRVLLHDTRHELAPMIAKIMSDILRDVVREYYPLSRLNRTVCASVWRISN